MYMYDAIISTCTLVHTISNCVSPLLTERNARALDKFLLQAGTLSTRQMDTVKSLVRLGSLLKLAAPLNILANYVRSLARGECVYLIQTFS